MFGAYGQCESNFVRSMGIERLDLFEQDLELLGTIENGLESINSEGKCEFVGHNGSRRISDRRRRERRTMDFRELVLVIGGLVLCR